LPSLQPVRGTHDIWPEDMRRHRAVVETARAVAQRYGYEEMSTPVFEFTEVFARTLGDTSDIVTKEMYTFPDREGELLTLRPEATAGICRAVITSGLTRQTPLKYFYTGPMFRSERPQKGRYRQFHQIDIELFGVAQPVGDIEVIACAAEILRRLGVLDRTVLELNTLGDTESRTAYRAVLVEYLSGHRDALSKDSLDRLERNPLRVLDSKEESDRKIVADAPLFGDYLNPASRDYFQAVKDGLDAIGIAYKVSPRLVRGLDYYCHTAFEFVTTDLGSQGTVLGGGRYDGLIELMGGPSTPGIGWAAGIERLAMLTAEPPAPPRPVAIVPLGEAAERKALALTEQLRRDGFHVDLGYGGNMSRRMKRANRVNAAAAVILGDNELAQGVAGLKNLDSGEQEQIALDQLATALQRYR
jgi:histidyl-tRNA synthetase